MSLLAKGQGERGDAGLRRPQPLRLPDLPFASAAHTEDLKS